MTRYDSRIIYSFTDSLYSRADTVVRVCTALGAILVGGLFALFGAAIDSGWFLWLLVGLAIGAAIGYFIGDGKAFELRLQAQSLLCQVAIEENTRKVLEASTKGGEIATNALPAPTEPVATPIKKPVVRPRQTSPVVKRSCPDCGAQLSSVDEFCRKCLAEVK